MSSTTPGGYGPVLEPPPSKRRTGLIVGVVGAVVAAVGLPLGGFAAYNALSGGGAQPHDALPAAAIGYLRLDVDPSASQKIEALQLLDRFPAFEEATGIENPQADLRKALFDAIQEETDCGLDFEDDVDPWLGERIGAAVFAPTDGAAEPGFAVAVQVKDEDAATAGIDELLGCGGGEKDAGWAYFNDYLIVAATQELAEGYARSAQESSLSENEVFAADMERLGEQGVASLWFDGQGIADVARAALGAGLGMATAGMVGPFAGMEQAVQQSYRSGAVAFRFDDSYLEVASVVSGDAYEELDDAGTASATLPESTALAFGVADGDRWVGSQWESMLQLQGGGQDTKAQLEQFEAATGLRLPEDLQTLLGSNFALALDGEGLAELIRAGNPTLLRLGARIATDQAEFDDLFATVQDLAARSGVPLTLTKVETDDGVAVATSPEFAQVLADGGSLGDTAKFSLAVKDASQAQAYAYVEVDAFEQALGALAGGAMLANVEPIEAVGVSSRIHDGYVEGTLRVTVN